MNFTTYAGLQSAIADELNRTDLTTSIPGFIALSEAQTERRLRVRDMLTRATLSIGAEFVSMPADLLETRSIRLDTSNKDKVVFLTIDEAEEAESNAGVGKPAHYTVTGNEFQFIPAPDVAYSARLMYYAKIPRLSNTTTSNWLLEKHPDIYFYGALLNSAPYLKDDARITVWGEFYQAAIDDLLIADDRARSASAGLKATARAF